jgi:cell wall-associated NlpC family hydrolase
MTVRQRFATLLVACAVFCGGAVTLSAGSARAEAAVSRAEAATADEIAVSAAGALAAMGTDQFAVRLGNVASATSQRLEIDSARLFTAWAGADRPHQIALLSALTQVGVPYRRNASKVGVAFDCSGLTLWAWSQSGIELAHNSTRQLRNAALRTQDTAQAGDLVYYPGHVMLWLGVDEFIVHAPQRGVPVEVGQVSDRRVKRAKFADPVG